MIEQIIAAMATAGVYSLIWYGTQRIDPTKPNPTWTVWQLLATVVLGAILGIGFGILDLPVDQASITLQMGALAFLLAAIERILKAIWRYLVKRFPAITEACQNE